MIKIPDDFAEEYKQLKEQLEADPDNFIPTRNQAQYRNMKFNRPQDYIDMHRVYSNHYYHAHKDKARAYYLKNKDRINANKRAWYANNRERVKINARIANKKHYWKDHEKSKAQARKNDRARRQREKEKKLYRILKN